jgi:hypothetical protein
MFQPLTAPGALGDGPQDASFGQALQDAVREAEARRPRRPLTFLTTTPATGGAVPRAESVTVCNGVVITDKRRVH